MEQDRRPKQSTYDGFDPNPASGRRSKRFWLEHGKHIVELRPGVLLIGRSSGCHVVLDDAMVSRRHAQLRVGSEVVNIEDYGSVNGVYVNSRRVQGAETLKEGDHIQIGTQELVLRAAVLAQDGESGERFSADTMHGMTIPPELSGRQVVGESEATFSAHTLDLLGGVADKVLALGRGEEAEKMLSTTLQNLLADVRAKKGGPVSMDVCDRAALHAVRLASATGKPKWIDYAIELFTLLERPLPAAAVDRLHEALRRTTGINVSGLRGYLELLRRMQQSFGPAERFLLQRLEGLEPIVGLR